MKENIIKTKTIDVSHTHERGLVEYRAAEAERMRRQTRSVLLADMWETSLVEELDAEKKCETIRRTYLLGDDTKVTRREKDARWMVDVRQAAVGMRDAREAVRKYRQFLTTTVPKAEQEFFGEMSDVLMELVTEALKCYTPDEVRERFGLK